MSDSSLLIVDDERAIRTLYQAIFEAEGYQVFLAKNGQEALTLFREKAPDLVLLDVTMPGKNGFKVCEEIRALDVSVPILFLTAMADDANQLRALSLGADDYIYKTAAQPILVARVQSALARQQRLKPEAPAEVTPTPDERIHLGRISVNLNSLEVYQKEGVVARLTQNEAMLLRVLYRARGHLFTRDELLAAMHGAPYKLQASALRGYISNLRQKLGPAGKLISTDWNRGYRLI